MTNRSASATIKGYFYQFDQTIVRLLEASKTASVTVEGIEDIDLDDGNESALVQCKYYEGTEYNHSVIKDAVILMLRHFHAQGCPANQVLRYRLYGHYKDGHAKLTLPLTIDFLKESLLTFSSKNVEHKVHHELNISDAQLDSFRALLDIDINAPSYAEQQKRLVQLLIDKIDDCTATDAEVFYYPSAINVIQGLAVEVDEATRKITRERFLKQINRKEVIFSSWLTQKFGADYFARLIRRKHFRFNATKVPKASRIFSVEMQDDFDASKAAKMIEKLGEFFSHKELQRTPPQDRFAPYFLLRGIDPAVLVEVKTILWRKGVKFTDGYPFLGSDYSANLLASDPTKDNLWRVKFIPTEAQLASSIQSLSGSFVELYDLYKTQPLDATTVPKGTEVHPIKCTSFYFIQEVMQS